MSLTSSFSPFPFSSFSRVCHSQLARQSLLAQQELLDRILALEREQQAHIQQVAPVVINPVDSPVQSSYGSSPLLEFISIHPNCYCLYILFFSG